MNKEQYFEKSNEKQLPLRCPILNYCGRRIYTIYFNSEYNKYDSGLTVLESLQKRGEIPDDFETKKIDNQGESPTIIRGNSSLYCNNMCPEVNLFDNQHSLFTDVACIEGDYDNERRTIPKSTIIKCGHFSECPEFNMYLFEKSLKNQTITNKKKRKNIPNKIKAVLQKEINSTCPYCSNKDVEHFQIHHLDENPINNTHENLIMLCPNCHSKITKGDISIDNVKQTKKRLTDNGIS